jgi:hypothetical protein
MNFDELLTSDNNNIQELAQKACELKLLLDSQQISEEEFAELLSDLKNLKYIDGQMNQLILMNDLKNVVNAIEQVRSWAP